MIGGNTPSALFLSRFCVEVVGIIKRNWRPYCGVLLPALTKHVSTFHCEPSRLRDEAFSRLDD